MFKKLNLTKTKNSLNNSFKATAKLKNNLGFTLIELLVVISIIGLLSSVVMASLNSARSKARDIKRVQGLQQVQIALEMYYNENGSYPNNATGGASNMDCWECGIVAWRDLNKLAVLSPYLKTRPIDPSIPTSGFFVGAFDGLFYKTSANMQDYAIAMVNVSENWNSIPANMKNTTFWGGSNSIFLSTPNAKNWILFGAY